VNYSAKYSGWHDRCANNCDRRFLERRLFLRTFTGQGGEREQNEEQDGQEAESGKHGNLLPRATSRERRYLVKVAPTQRAGRRIPAIPAAARAERGQAAPDHALDPPGRPGWATDHVRGGDVRVRKGDAQDSCRRTCTTARRSSVLSRCQTPACRQATASYYRVQGPLRYLQHGNPTGWPRSSERSSCGTTRLGSWSCRARPHHDNPATKCLQPSHSW